jgi:DNA polymerase I-like protein with 3'-5' exonuclease and polymerase domains
MLTIRASETDTLAPNSPERRWAYNALDCCATHGAAAEMRQLVAADPCYTRVYTAERRLLAPALAVSMRGIRVDTPAATWGSRCLKRAMTKCERHVQKLAGDPSLNIGSWQQLRRLFYGTWGLAELRNKDGDVSTDESVMTRIRDNQRLEWTLPKDERPPEATVREAAAAILKFRTWSKEREIYAARLHNGRMRCTLSVGSTETWRFSSSKSSLGDGRNLQNVKKPRRIIFVPDPGFTMYQIDQKQAESLTVAYLCCDEAYIRAHLTSDTHIAVAHICNPDADWPDPSDPAATSFYRREGWLGDWSIRDAYKRIQHLLNYGGTYAAVARTLHIPEREAHIQVERYYAAFPGIPRWHEEVGRQIRADGVVYYPGGYKRTVLGHRNDPKTLRDILASFGQSIIGWINHTAFAAIWHEFDGSFLPGAAGPPLQVLMHGHDAVLYQSRTPELAQAAHDLASSITWPMPAGDMRVPWDFKSGPNWKAVS